MLNTELIANKNKKYKIIFIMLKIENLIFLLTTNNDRRNSWNTTIENIKHEKAMKFLSYTPGVGVVGSSVLAFIGISKRLERRFTCVVPLSTHNACIYVCLSVCICRCVKG